MTTLREPFDKTHQKKQETKQGPIYLDYIQWSQAADRLDDVGEPWSFAIMGIGPDWVHGRLTIGERHFENIGYVENADQAWKKETLKDAASDAFKRCASLAGVGRYLYDRDDTSAGAPARSSGNGRAAAPPPPARPPARSSTDVPEDPYADLPPEWDAGAVNAPKAATGRSSGSGWSFKELAEATEAKGLPKNTIYATADQLFGKGKKVTELSPDQREQIAFEMGLVG